MSASIKSVRDLEVYKLAFEVAMRIFEITKKFPSEEKYSLTDQIRRSSRSVCSNLSEGWRKRAYIAAFKSKLADSMQEGSETQTWLDFSLACKYITNETHADLNQRYEIILAKLNNMDMKAETFCFKSRKQ